MSSIYDTVLVVDNGRFFMGGGRCGGGGVKRQECAVIFVVESAPGTGYCVFLLYARFDFSFAPTCFFDHEIER